MKQVFYGYIRRTFKYIDAWKDEDQHDYFGEFRILSHHFHPYNYDIDDGKSLIRVKSKSILTLNDSDLFNIMQNQFNYGCRCEHDCCGHVQSYVGGIEKPRNGRKDEIIVRVSHYQNI